MAFVEKTGKSVEDAVAEALKELNITAEQAEVEVIEEGKKGFFGFGRKDAKVRVSVKEQAAPAPQAPEKTVGEATAEAVKAVKEAAAIAVNTVSKKADSVKTEAVSAADEFTKKAAAAKEQAVDSAISALESLKSERPVREPRRYAVNDEAVNAAKEFLQKVFNAMKIDVVMEKFINKNDGSVTFKLHGDDMGILIGKHGQTLDSLQYLTNLVANKNSSERVRVIIDVEDYRDRRVETLSRLAMRLADKVKRTGERVALEPMNPHERKIIHMALQGDRRVTTLSEGDDPYRHVVIELKK
ncbi:MAG: RNA-binding cell elongation regulator Jag/EloR [Phascolarctobacterium sp.]|uniref:RNA-binding cell elongation regulator Jag/EloR n=1 Tax=Phascolarctobacterium sp. TaxID=2049039 RepID=UPI0026DDA84E|nr:RNA-binding cell elongation regulator Jag/EloR [Phascolarctobacterium sp.]MDO4922218.1 RNA-binding cell elongation regulator Jag/EloR [Phascolarctobacterium sp.]